MIEENAQWRYYFIIECFGLIARRWKLISYDDSTCSGKAD